MKFYIGITYGHDSSACIMDEDGRIIMAIAEERLSRHKHDGRFPVLSIEECLAAGKVSHDDHVELAYTNYEADDVVRFERKFYPGASKHIDDLRDASEYLLQVQQMEEDHSYRLKMRMEARANPDYQTSLVMTAIKAHFRKRYGIDLAKIQRVDHHTSHVASAFYNSPFEKNSVVFSLDGFGDGKSGGAYIINNGNLKELVTNTTAGSMGLMYQFVTGGLGYKELDGEWKLLGHEPYGDPLMHAYLFESMYEVFEKDSGFCIIRGRLGRSEAKDEDIDNPILGWPDYLMIKEFIQSAMSGIGYEDLEQKRANWSAAVQSVLEKISLEWVLRNLQNIETKENNICLTGGVFMNVKLNRLLRVCLPTWKIFVNPPSPDMGCSIGAAFLLKGKRDMKRPLDRNSFNGSQRMDIGPDRHDEGLDVKEPVSYGMHVMKQICDRLKEGRYVCLVQGRSEFGPRALLNRSILWDPSKSSDFLNIALGRTKIMPFAGSLLEQFAFDLLRDWKEMDISDEHMTMTYMATEEMTMEYPYVCHLLKEGQPRMTTRPQVVKMPGTFAHSLLKRWYLESNGKVLLNTSFNAHGEPIVESRMSAGATFKTMIINLRNANIDIKGSLVLGDRMIDEEDFIDESQF